jgi:hypothetical protein
MTDGTNRSFEGMPCEPDGLPGPDEINTMEVEYHISLEWLQTAFLTKDRDLAVKAYRVISGDPEANLPEVYDQGTKWRTREEIDAPLTSDQIDAANERIAIIRSRMADGDI